MKIVNSMLIELCCLFVCLFFMCACACADEWLDVENSLHEQGVHTGDVLYLRKKFFILNDDVVEAQEGNYVLSQLIYCQVTRMITIMIKCCLDFFPFFVHVVTVQ